MEKGIYKLENVANHFNLNPKVIFELGARDGEETLGLANIFKNSKVYSFECNPATIGIWKNKVKDNKRISCIEAAVSDKDGKIKFYPTTKESETTREDGNPGASSLFKASGKYEVEKYVQREIEVDTIKLETFIEDKNIDHIDIMWMDIQGAEGLALKGLGKKIKNIDIIYTEVEFMEIYKGQAMYKDIKKILSKDFMLYKFVNHGIYSSDVIFINRKLLKDYSKLRYIYTCFRSFLLYPEHIVIAYTPYIGGKILRIIKSVFKFRSK